MGWFKGRADAKINAERSAREMVEFRYSIWLPEQRTHVLQQTVRLPLPAARVLRAELDAAIGTAEARVNEGA